MFLGIVAGLLFWLPAMLPPTFVHGFSYGLCLDICSNSGMVGAD
jgi:hypothetical protein